MTYTQLFHQIGQKRSFLCIGLDSDRTFLPTHLKYHPNALYLFNKEIIDATAPFTIAYKPNTAFYEAEGSNGWKQLEDTVLYIRKNYPDIFIIADAKRGDIGNTAQRYAKAFFEVMDVDAVTLSPYMGMDAITPFLHYKDKWVIILALTSNESANDFELQLLVNEKPLYQAIIEKCSQTVSKEQLMFVVGATRPEKLGEIRQMVPEYFLLVPGVGAQGGSVTDVAKYGMNSSCGLLVNVSRDIIYAGTGTGFALSAKNRAEEIKKEMSDWLI